MKLPAVCAMALALLSTGAARAEPPLRSPVVFDRIVAVVDGEPILLSTLRERAAPFIHPSKGVPSYQSQKELHQTYRMLMKQLIDERLIDRAARAAGISFDRAFMDSVIDAVAVQNHMKKKELLEMVRASGISEDEYRAELRRQYAEAQLLYAFMRRVGVSLDGKGEKEQAAITRREHKRWMAELYRRASIQQYFRP